MKATYVQCSTIFSHVLLLKPSFPVQHCNARKNQTRCSSCISAFADTENAQPVPERKLRTKRRLTMYKALLLATKPVDFTLKGPNRKNNMPHAACLRSLECNKQIGWVPGDHWGLWRKQYFQVQADLPQELLERNCRSLALYSLIKKALEEQTSLIDGALDM